MQLSLLDHTIQQPLLSHIIQQSLPSHIIQQSLPNHITQQILLIKFLHKRCCCFCKCKDGKNSNYSREATIFIIIVSFFCHPPGNPPAAPTNPKVGCRSCNIHLG